MTRSRKVSVGGKTYSRRLCLCLEETARYHLSHHCLVVAYYCTVLAEQCRACLLAWYLYCASESGHGSRGRCMLHCLYYTHACACPALRVLLYQSLVVMLDMSAYHYSFATVCSVSCVFFVSSLFNIFSVVPPRTVLLDTDVCRGPTKGAGVIIQSQTVTDGFVR